MGHPQPVCQRGMSVVRERDEKKITMIDLRRASFPGEKRKEISVEIPRAVSLQVGEARRGAGGAWEVRGVRRRHLGEGISVSPSIIC